MVGLLGLHGVGEGGPGSGPGSLIFIESASRFSRMCYVSGPGGPGRFPPFFFRGIGFDVKSHMLFTVDRLVSTLVCFSGLRKTKDTFYPDHPDHFTQK